MRRWLCSLLFGVLPMVAWANDRGDEALQLLLDKADVVVAGQFTSEVTGESGEQGVVHYRGEFKIAELIKGAVAGERRAGGSIKLGAVRLEAEAADQHPLLKKDGRAILFLKCNDRQDPPTYAISDPWLGVQPLNSDLVKSLARLAGAPAKSVDLAGRWELHLPAGFEHAMTLTPEKENRYRLAPGGLTLGSDYRVEGNFLLSAGNDAKGGRFKWKINSPYLLTLIEQPARLNSDYRGAVFVRNSLASELQRNNEEKAAHVPQTSMAELDALVTAGNGHLVRQQRIGYELETIGIVESVSPHYPDWLIVELPSKFWHASLRNVRDGRGFKKGDKVKFRGLIVDEAYSTLQIWTYSATKVGFYSGEGTDLEFPGKHTFDFHKDVPKSELRLGLAPGQPAQANGQVLLPLTITNQTTSKIQSKLAHEWHGGIWPPTGLYASVTPLGEKQLRPFQPIYRAGEDASETTPTTLAPRESIKLQLRADWKGTGSVPAEPLIDKPGKYTVRFALVFDAGGVQQYFVSTPENIELAEPQGN